MDIQMIVTDLDGTLLRKDKTVSDYTVSVFERCRKKGIKIVFATARPIRTVQIMELGIGTDAVVYHNGAVISINGITHRHIGIEPKTTESLLLETANKYRDMQISVEIDDILYANFDVTKVWANTTAIMTDFSDLPDIPADKIIFVTADKKTISEIESSLPDGIYMEIVENQIVMVMNKNARKRNAVEEVAKHFGLGFGKVAAFGDDHNDVEMLKDCGTGVAVTNAVDEAKAAADYICGTNDSDGAAKWIEENVL